MDAELIEQFVFGRGRIEQMRRGRLINQTRERTKPPTSRARREVVEGGALVGKLRGERFMVGFVLERFGVADAFGFEQAALISERVFAFLGLDLLQTLLLRVAKRLGEPDLRAVKIASTTA